MIDGLLKITSVDVVVFSLSLSFALEEANPGIVLFLVCVWFRARTMMLIMTDMT